MPWKYPVGEEVQNNGGQPNSGDAPEGNAPQADAPQGNVPLVEDRGHVNPGAAPARRLTPSVPRAVTLHGGDLLARLPMMSRTLQGEWRRLFALDQEDAYPKLAVRPGPGGWYLTGGAPASIALEVLRAKKIGMARVVMDPGSEDKPCCGASETDAADECCQELPGIAS